MNKKDLRAYQERQFQLFLARAARWTAVINSGAYKFSKTERGCGKNENGTIQFRPLTDDEKLEDALATLDRHLYHAQTFLDAIDYDGSEGDESV